MKISQSLSIKIKLIMIIVGVSFIIALSGQLITCLSHITSLKDDLKNNAVLNAELVGQYCVVPLTFQYIQEANEVLNKLTAIHYIKNACVYDEKGMVFSTYKRDGDGFSWPDPAMRIDNAFFENGFLHVFHPIIYQDMKYGTIYLQVETSHLRGRIVHELWLKVPVILTLLLISFLIAYGLQRPISESIKRLADVAQELAEKKDYSVRVETKRGDEIGELYKRFNYLCEQIEYREKERDLAEKQIRKLNEDLELRIKQRTARLQESEQRLKLALQGGKLGSWDINLQTEVAIYDEQWAEIIGYSLDDIDQTRQTWLNSIHPDDRARVLKVGRDYRSGIISEYEVEYRSVTKQGKVIWVFSKGAAVEWDDWGSPIRMIGTVQDISERKRMEEELIIAKNQAEKATRAKSDFLANMSHEIRTPMNAIIGLTHLALRTELTLKQRDYLQKIDTSAKSLLRIINDILDFSKIEAGKLTLESAEFYLDDILEDLSTIIPVKAAEKDLEILFQTEPDVPISLSGDALRLGQVLLNLINNAIKFTEKGEVVVSVELVDKMNGKARLRFSVRDTGIGMIREQVEKLFQPFIQADTSTTRKFGGTGLGLTISKQLVEMMNGEIGVKSEFGKGTTFTFTAVFGMHSKKKKRRDHDVGDLKGMRVLIVDDSITSQEILRSMLENMAFDVSVAVSGKDGIKALERETGDNCYNLVIMDWKMPGMDGISAIRKIRNSGSEFRNIPIILVTAYGIEEVVRQAEFAGVDGYLIKPVTQSMLFDAIMEAFGRDIPERERAKKKWDQEREALKGIRGARILLVEDNEINQQVAMEILEGAGLIVTIANNGKEAVESFKENVFDAVLMDVQMPVMDGFAATWAIRNMKIEARNLPIIAMTAHAMAGDREKSLDAGMNDHITKPIDPDELFSSLLRWIKPLPGRSRMKGLSYPDLLRDEDYPVEEKEIFPESLPGIDVKSAMSRIGGNQALFRRLLIKFHANHGNTEEEIASALEKGEMERAMRIAHTIKGLAGNIGANDLYEAASGLEEAIRAENNELDSLMARFSESLKQVLSSAGNMGENSEQDGPGDSAPVEPDVSDIMPILEELKILLEQDDTRAVKTLDKYREALKGSCRRNALDELERLVGEYDFAEALEVLDGIKKGMSIPVGKDKADTNGGLKKII